MEKALWRSPECGLSHLYSAVTPVSYDDVPVGIHSYTSGSIELAVAFTMRAKFEQEFSICIVHLKEEEVSHQMHFVYISLCTLIHIIFMKYIGNTHAFKE